MEKMAQELENTENRDISLGKEDKDKKETVTIQKESANIVADSVIDLWRAAHRNVNPPYIISILCQ